MFYNILVLYLCKSYVSLSGLTISYHLLDRKNILWIFSPISCDIEWQPGVSLYTHEAHESQTTIFPYPVEVTVVASAATLNSSSNKESNFSDSLGAVTGRKTFALRL